MAKLNLKAKQLYFVKKVLAYLYFFMYNNECATAQMEGAGKLFFVCAKSTIKKGKKNKKLGGMSKWQTNGFICSVKVTLA